MIAVFTAAVDQSIINNAIDEWCGRLRACVGASLDTLNNFCDNNNIHSAIWMKLSFFDKYDTSFNFVLQFYNKFEL